MVLSPAYSGAPVPHPLNPVFGLSPEEPCREAVRVIVRRTLALARQYEQGIIDDIDTDFLHDYRICIRKIRSLICLMKGAYPDADTERLKNQLGDIARTTNQLRDLDVYLLSRKNYIALLPASLQAGLNAFFEDIQRTRSKAQKDVARHLRSNSYLVKVDALAAFFTEPDILPASKFSAHPIKDRASRHIYCRYRRIRKASGAITSGTPDIGFHTIRIECKKLRYMLEFFGELYDHDEFECLLKNLKRVQHCLGSFNDYAVQQNSLLDYSEAHKKMMSVEQALSVGGLVSVLNLQQLEERLRAEKALDTFSKARIQRRFRQVFQPA